MSLLPEGVHGAAQIWQTDSSYWGWENSHPAPIRSALELLGAVFSPHFSLYTNECTSNVHSASFRKVTSLLTDRRLRSWMSGADSLNNLELNTLKTVKMTWGEPPPLLSPTYHHDHHCDCSGVIYTFQLHMIYLYKTTVYCYIPLHKIVDFILSLLIYLFYFFILLFIICVFVLSLTFCCTLEASVTKTNSSYV